MIIPIALKFCFYFSLTSALGQRVPWKQRLLVLTSSACSELGKQVETNDTWMVPSLIFLLCLGVAMQGESSPNPILPCRTKLEVLTWRALLQDEEWLTVICGSLRLSTGLVYPLPGARRCWLVSAWPSLTGGEPHAPSGKLNSGQRNKAREEHNYFHRKQLNFKHLM